MPHATSVTSEPCTGAPGTPSTTVSARPRRGRQMDVATLRAPEVDIREENNQLKVSADLPGIPKDAVRIDIQDGALVIQGERSEERNRTSRSIHAF